jgi:hypothetical protein
MPPLEQGAIIFRLLAYCFAVVGVFNIREDCCEEPLSSGNYNRISNGGPNYHIR